MAGGMYRRIVAAYSAMPWSVVYSLRRWFTASGYKRSNLQYGCCLFCTSAAKGASRSLHTCNW